MAGPSANAQAPQANFERRVRDVAAIMALKGGEEAVFAPSFLAEIPVPKIRELAQHLTKQNGGVQGIASITANDGYDGLFTLTYDRAVVWRAFWIGCGCTAARRHSRL